MCLNVTAYNFVYSVLTTCSDHRKLTLLAETNSKRTYQAEFLQEC